LPGDDGQPLEHGRRGLAHFGRGLHRQAGHIGIGVFDELDECRIIQEPTRVEGLCGAKAAVSLAETQF
jgi:hypothetical protein